MAMKVLCVEVGQGLTHVVEMDYMVKSPKVYNCFSFKTPDGVVADGTVTRNNAFTNALNVEKSKRNIKTNRIIYTVASSRIANRDVTIPMCKDKEIQSIVNANANNYFPVDMNQYHLVYKKRGTVKVDDAEQIKLALLAVPNEISKSYFAFSEAIRHPIRGIDYMGNSVFQAARHSVGKGVQVVVKIDAGSSMITIIRDDKIALQRNISYGISNAADIVQEYLIKQQEAEQKENNDDLEQDKKEKATYMDAVIELCNKPFVAPSFEQARERITSADADEMVKELRTEVTNSFRYLAGNVSRILDYYSSRNDNVEYDGITAIGIGADILGLTELLSNELEMEVRQLTNIKDVTILDKNKEIQLGEYAAAIGAGIQTWNIIPAGMGIQKDLKESLFLPFIVGIGCVVVSMALYVYGQIDYSIQVSDRDAKIEQKAALADAQAKEDAYEQAVSDYNSIVAISNAATNNNSELVDLLGDMEIALPKSFDISSITSDNTQVVMNCTVDTKEEAATVISELRKFDLLSTVTSSGFSETDAGVSFTLTCTYATVTEVAAN